MPSDALCHPDGDKSCGACCGMYNHVEHGEEQTLRRLRERTLAFRRDAEVDDPASLAVFRAEWEDSTDVKLLEKLPSCPFLGFVDVENEDDEGERVGCLVHPLQNDGVDGRDCGVYDRFICEEYLCAAHDVLDADQAQLVIDAVDDSFLYGLMITNPKFVRELLDLVADRTGAWPTGRVLKEPEVIEAAGECFELMRDWPHREGDGICGQLKVTGPLETKRRGMPAERHDGVEPADVDVLLVCLGTECDDVAALQDARQMVEERVQAVAEVVERVRATW